MNNYFIKHNLKTAQKSIRESSAGFMFLEIIIAVALISRVFITLLGIGGVALSLATSVQKTTEADSLIREELKAIRSLREGTVWATDGLATLATGPANPYYAAQDTTANPPKWKFNAGIETVGVFTRKAVFDKVSRDPSAGDIETMYNAAHDDPDTRKVTVTVTLGAKTYQVISYFTNWN